jgi:hypothetical protein
MEREYLGYLLRFGKAMRVPRKELPHAENFTVTIEFHCFLVILRKLFEDSHHSALFSIFDRVMHPEKWTELKGDRKTRNPTPVVDDYSGSSIW